MTTIRVRLQWALAHLEGAKQHLEVALQNARDRGYTPNWIAAIEKASADNQKVMLHIGNIRDLITLHLEAPISDPRRKEN